MLLLVLLSPTVITKRCENTLSSSLGLARMTLSNNWFFWFFHRSSKFPFVQPISRLVSEQGIHCRQLCHQPQHQTFLEITRLFYRHLPQHHSSDIAREDLGLETSASFEGGSALIWSIGAEQQLYTYSSCNDGHSF